MVACQNRHETQVLSAYRLQKPRMRKRDLKPQKKIFGVPITFQTGIGVHLDQFVRFFLVYGAFKNLVFEILLFLRTLVLQLLSGDDKHINIRLCYLMNNFLSINRLGGPSSTDINYTQKKENKSS